MNAAQLDECVLCCREIKIYATGICDHPVCFKCSARMRVLIETTECPICRSNLPVVVFTHQPQTYSTSVEKHNWIHKKHQIIFEDEDTHYEFKRLLENRCQACDELLPTFELLKKHYRKNHDLHFCDLCVNNLGLFPGERKCYSMKDLARHRKIGDKDDSSHKGHPICEFCDERYMDNDDLFRHLRKAHFYCYFCDADGKNQYYNNYDYLRAHFRSDHYLCEEDNCINEQYTNAFRTEIDLKCHQAQEHSRNKSKAEAKQARKLDLEFPLVDRSTSPRGRRYAQNKSKNSSATTGEISNLQAELENLNMQSVQDFPYLSKDNTAASTPMPNGTGTVEHKNRPPSTQTTAPKSVFGQRRNVMSTEDFPPLKLNANSNDGNTNIKDWKTQNTNSRAKSAQTNHLQQKNRPAQTNKPTVQNGVHLSEQSGKWINKKTGLNLEDDFPSLEVKKKTRPTPVIQPTPIRNDPPPPPPKPSPPEETDHFVVIKSKVKKKRQNKLAAMEEDEKMEEEPKDIFGFSKRDDEKQDPFKKDMVHPVLVSKPAPLKLNDHWEEEFEYKLTKDDFPPLAQNKPIKQPPGFGTSVKKAPPPGFGSSLNRDKPSMDTTEATKMAIRDILMPKENNKSLKKDIESFEFLKPPNFELRNTLLTNKIFTFCRNPELYNSFKVQSKNFRENTISASEYHTKCLEILGLPGFLEVFPELVSLLPVIEKQQELFTVHNGFLSQRNGGAIPKKTKQKNLLEACDVCNQVLVVYDHMGHLAKHSPI